LLFTAGDFMRIASHDRSGIVEIDVTEQLDGERTGIAPLQAAMPYQRFRDLRSDW